MNKGDRGGVNPKVRHPILNVGARIALKQNVLYGSKRKKSGNKEENWKRERGRIRR